MTSRSFVVGIDHIRLGSIRGDGDTGEESVRGFDRYSLSHLVRRRTDHLDLTGVSRYQKPRAIRGQRGCSGAVRRVMEAVAWNFCSGYYRKVSGRPDLIRSRRRCSGDKRHFDIHAGSIFGGDRASRALQSGIKYRGNLIECLRVDNHQRLGGKEVGVRAIRTESLMFWRPGTFPAISPVALPRIERTPGEVTGYWLPT